MTTFLEKTAEYLYKKYNSETEILTIILPNRRGSLYLKKYLAKHYKSPFWSPKFFSIEDYINQLADKRPANPIFLFNELYKIHLQINSDNYKSFDEFIGIAELLLADFNEIDLYLVDINRIFDYISETKAMELWNLDGKPLTAFQQNFLSFYKLLKVYYFRLSERISKLSIAYQGYNYRYVAENIEKIVDKNSTEHFIFLGFNALTPSEEKIINYFKNNFNTEIICDIDRYYFDNQNQEAGLFLRKLKKSNFINENTLFIEDNLAKNWKKIDLIGVPMKIGQVKYTNEILTNIRKEEPNLESTAIVLCDENLLLPLIMSLPDEIGNYNVTMGLPLKQTMIFDLFDSILLFHENHNRFYNVNKQSKSLHYIDLLKILRHNFSKNAFNTQHIIDSITKSNQIFYDFDEISSLLGEFCPQNHFLINIFNPHLSPKELIDSLLGLINNLKENDQILKNELNVEFLYRFSIVLNQLVQNIDFDSNYINPKVIRKLFKSITNLESIPFYGEPLSGLQVIGVLETRLLDFKNIIFLSVNEGVMPKSHQHNSLIPLSIKKDFGIAVNFEKDAVFAYHFFRLLQRAENVKILYNTEPDEFSGGDKSRFIYQLCFELAKANRNISLNDYILNIPEIELKRINKIQIKKNEEVFEKLILLKNNGFSATSLMDYLKCKLNFYFKYIAKIKIPNITEENIKENTKGSIIHFVLRDLYRPFVNLNITSNDIDGMNKALTPTLEKAFDFLYKDGTVNHGLNFLTYELVSSWIKNFLNYEKANLLNLNRDNKNLKLISVESEYKSKITTTIDNQTIDVTLKGNIDRIDLIDNCFRVIDYKSGFVKNDNVQVAEISKVIEKKHSYAFQLLFYFLLLKDKFPQFIDYKCDVGVISILTPSAGLIKLSVNKKEIDNDDIVEFQELLNQILSEVFDRNIPFYQTEEEDNCKYCDYSEICNKGQFLEN